MSHRDVFASRMLKDMKQGVAFITGVGPGLGAAVARRFAREGFSVAIIARTPDFIDELAREISGAGGRPSASSRM